MRADRLLSLLMMLQARGRVTAETLAQELEVSVRTVYRDLDALSGAGVPVYAEKGPGGGIALLESYRTTLTGLTTEESRALFMLNIPAPLAQLGVSQELKTALLKLSAALPASRRAEEERARQRFHLDAVGWSQSLEPAPYLQLVQQALWNDRRLKLFYRTFFGTLIERVGEPLGLVAKASVWYLVYTEAEVRRVVRVADLLQVDADAYQYTREETCAKDRSLGSGRQMPRIFRCAVHNQGQKEKCAEQKADSAVGERTEMAHGSLLHDKGCSPGEGSQEQIKVSPERIPAGLRRRREAGSEAT